MSPIQTEPGIGDISPVSPEGVEVEPMLLLDTTGSMTWPNEQGGKMERRDVLKEAMGIIVTELGKEDSQAAAEAAAGEDAGGLMTVTFADGTDFSKDEDDHPANGKIGDLSPENWQNKWAKLQWGGSTTVMPGWNALNEVFLDEFGDTPALDRPKMLALIITDGEANDTSAFAEEMKKIKNRAYVCIAVMGYGDEHDKALALYEQVASTNDHIRVVSFGNTSDPNGIATAVLSLLG